MIYELIILGGGPAGYNAAARACRAGLSTLLIEKNSIGGVCLNEGCIPSKALLYSAKLYDGAMHGESYGIIARDIRLDHGVVIERKDRIVKTMVSRVRNKLKKGGVTLINGFGEILGRNSEGYEVKADNEVYTGKRLLVSTGSMPFIPQIPGVKEGLASGYILTNREILGLKAVPASLVIIGGGVIGLEMAAYYNSAGSRVTVIEMLDHIAGNTDREISGILYDNYSRKGIDFKLGAKVVEIGESSVIYELGGMTYKADAEKVLLSIGRRPATEGFGLEKLGVELERGSINVDNRGRTNVPEVYAAGDVNGTSMLAHTAYREGEVCVNNMLGKKDIMRYHAIPSVIYTNPEVACVGETEESARQKGLDYEVVKTPMNYSGRYAAENEGGDGICKVLIDRNSRKLLGVHMIGSYASEVIYGAGIMLETELRTEDIKELVFPHPTVSEIIRDSIFEF